MSVSPGKTKGTWYVYVDRPRRKGEPRRRRCYTVHGKKADANRLDAELKHNKNTGRFVEPDRQTLGEYLTTWLETKKTNLTPQSYRGTASSLNHVLKTDLRNIPLQELTSEDIQAKINQLFATGRSSGTCNNLFACLRNALNRAVRLRKIPYNPVLDVETPKVQRYIPKPWSSEQIQYFLKYISDSGLLETNPYSKGLILVLFTGLRLAEVCGLRWSAVDLENRTLFIGSTRLANPSGGGFHEKFPKSFAGRRVVELTAAAVDLLRGIRGEQMENRIRYPYIQWEDDPFVVAKFDGSVFRPETLTRNLHKIRTAAGLPYTNTRMFRHAHATMLNELGYDHAALARRMGHSDVRTTLQIYTDFRPAEYSERLAKLDDRLPLFTDTITDKKNLS